jgi:hypothetical protein
MGSFSPVFFIAVIAVAAFLRLNPEVVLKVPRIGFVLYHFVKGAPIPPYVVHDQWVNDSAWLKTGDVVVSVAAKSGTTWAMATVHAIRTKALVDYRDITDVVPWADFVRYPGETLDERIEFFKRASKPFTFGAYKSHDAPPLIKIRPDVKYIAGIRDPVDILASFKGFLATHSVEFSKMWGGFPDLNQSDEDYFKMMLVDKGDGTGLMDNILDYWVGWWPHRYDSNVLILNYADRLKDSHEDIRRIAKFLDVSLTDVEVDRIVASTDFKWMKKNTMKFSYAFEPEGVQQLKGTPAANIIPIIGEGLVSKGKDRRGRDEVPLQYAEETERKCLRRLGPEICVWLKTGGPLPNVEIPQ